jgi:hypothetical protein
MFASLFIIALFSYVFHVRVVTLINPAVGDRIACKLYFTEAYLIDHALVITKVLKKFSLLIERVLTRTNHTKNKISLLELMIFLSNQRVILNYQYPYDIKIYCDFVLFEMDF